MAWRTGGEAHLGWGVKPAGSGGSAWAVVWTLFAAVVGAGFATGRELVTFFGPCRPWPPAWALTACLGTGLVAGARALPAPCPFARSVPYARAVRAVLWVTAAWVSWVALVAMEAALALLVRSAVPWKPAAMTAAGLSVWVGASLPAGTGLARISRLLGPFMAGAILVLAAAGASLSAPREGGPAAGPSAPHGGSQGAGPPPYTGARCAVHSLLYAASNGLFAAAPVAAVAGQVGRLHLLAWSVAGGMLLGATGAAALHLIARAGTAGAEMPLVAAAAQLHAAAAWIHTAAVAASVYTTAVAAAVGLTHLVTPAVVAPAGRRETVAGVVSATWVLSAMPAASLGFSAAVQRFYPVAGWTALLTLTLEGLFARLSRRRLY